MGTAREAALRVGVAAACPLGSDVVGRRSVITRLSMIRAGLLKKLAQQTTMTLQRTGAKDLSQMTLPLHT